MAGEPFDDPTRISFAAAAVTMVAAAAAFPEVTARLVVAGTGSSSMVKDTGAGLGVAMAGVGSGGRVRQRAGGTTAKQGEGARVG